MKKDDTRRDSGAAGAARSTQGAPIVAVAALMEERRRYEGWITALEARRAATPEHVFLRVHADYRARLDAVIVELTKHSDSLRREMESLTNRLVTIREEHQQAMDERAEAELRAHVGELSEAEWEATASASDKRIADLGARQRDVEAELSKTTEMLDEARRPAPAAESRPSGPVPAPRATASRRVSTDMVDVADDQPLEAAAGEPAGEPVGEPASEQQTLDIRERPSRGAGFDELAFLSSVVDTPPGDIDPAPVDEPDEKTRRDSFAQRSQEDAIVNLTDVPRTPLDSPAVNLEKERAPLIGAAAKPDEPSVIGDKSGEGAKTLKCGECSSMNYPTEWYCERCGAELASL